MDLQSPIPKTRDYGPTRPAHYTPTMEDELLVWASVHDRQAFEATGTRDEQWWDRCLASIFRARCMAANCEAWIDHALALYPDEVRRIAPLIKQAGPWRVTREWLAARLALVGEVTEVARPARVAPVLAVF